MDICAKKERDWKYKMERKQDAMANIIVKA